MLDGAPATTINPDLSGLSDLTTARRLPENAGLVFMGDTKGGSFDIPGDTARAMLAAPVNPNGRPNSDVVRPWINSLDVTRRPRDMWIIDFGVSLSETAAALYEAPYEHVKGHVKPMRAGNKRAAYRDLWWIHAEPRPAMRAALAHLARCVTTPSVSKHRIFAWLRSEILPDHQVFVFARDDDYFFGVLHSRVHELWARSTGTQLREAESGFRYTPTSTFDTFPLPWVPGKEPTDDARVVAIADAARDLVALRDRWLNPAEAPAATVRERTLTNLYNERPTWLANAHDRLDRAVLDAYGWPRDLSDEDILSRLLALNLERTSSLASSMFTGVADA